MLRMSRTSPQQPTDRSPERRRSGLFRVDRGAQPPWAEEWRELGDPDLVNTVRRICTLCGWAQAAPAAGRSLAITSAVEREGKSSLAWAMAITLAHDHAREVLLVDCNLQHPTLGGDGATDPGPGLTELLAGEIALDDALRRTRVHNLWLLPAGGISPNPSRLLRSPAFSAMLHGACERFAFVIVDLPAVLKSSDAAVIARQTDGAVLVVRGGTTDQRHVRQAVELLQGANLHGAILNRWRSGVPDLVRRIAQI